MSRDLNRSTNVIDLGDVSAARYEVGTAWTQLGLYQFGATSDDDNALVSKWPADANKKQILLRSDQQSAPSNLELFFGGSLRITGSSSIELNTWYGYAIVHDGTSSVGSTTLYNADLAGSFTDDGLTNGGAWSDVSDLTEPIMLGARAGNDNMNGLLSHTLYVTGEVTRAEFLAWLKDPFMMTVYFKEKYGLPWWLVLEGTDSPEPDWSGNGNDGTVTGATKGDNPPVRWLGSRLPTIGVPAATGASTLIAAAGAYAWTGQTAGLLHDSLITAEAGSYAWAGQTANLLYSTVLSAEAGSYAWAGQDVNLLYNARIGAESGSYAWTGQDATLTHLTGAILTADAGAYAWDGATVNLLHNSVLSAEAGSYIWSGQAAGLTHSGASIWTATTPASTSWSEESSVSSTWTPTSKPSTDWTES